jgi:hypothetical protein
MKSNSDSIPLTTVKSNGLTQVRYDAVEVTRENPDGSTKTSYDFTYVEIAAELTRDKIIAAIITDVHSKDAEIALINNELASPGTEQYTGYQALRAHAKEIADAVMELI